MKANKMGGALFLSLVLCGCKTRQPPALGEPLPDLTPEQRRAHLVFWYESEMQNGGHLQYFENRGAEHLEETVYALGLLGAKGQ